MDKSEIKALKEEIEKEWFENIAPFWLKHSLDKKHGGFYGLVSKDLIADEKAEKGIILNSRILWTFSKAYSIYKRDEYFVTAKRAFDYLIKHFFDEEHGGVFWTVDYKGKLSDTKKRPYAQGFAVYALAEYYSVTKDELALQKAFELFEVIEAKCRDKKFDGYFETFEREWKVAEDLRLSKVDQNEAKSMNNHLHVLEGYTNLYKVSKNENVGKRLKELVKLFHKKIIDKENKTLHMFFDEDWTPKSNISSLGHDIETSWLLCEAIEFLGDETLQKEVQKNCLELVEQVYKNGIAGDGSLLYESENGKIINADREWWVQAEAVVGFINAFHISQDEKFLNSAKSVWNYTRRNVIDREKGGWHWRIKAKNNLPDSEKPKISQWKCPYHNGRMCFEVAKRLSI